MLFIFGISTAQGVKFGVKAGVNSSRFTIDNLNTIDVVQPTNESRTSFHVGGTAEIKISEKFSFQPELVYQSIGGRSNVSQNSLGFTFQQFRIIKMDYITLPLMAKYFVSTGLSVEAGPQIGFLLSNKTQVETTDFNGGVANTEVTTVDNKDTTQSIDFGVSFGVSYILQSNLFFSARYYAGLTNFNKPVVETDRSSFRNGVFQLSAGYQFN